MESKRVLIVDLNNFARYPTVAVGYLTACLRAAGQTATVFSPLACGVGGVVREPRPKPWGLAVDKLKYLTAVSTAPLVKAARAKLAARSGPMQPDEEARVLAEFDRTLQRERPDVVLISAYLMYRGVCQAMAGICARAAVPLLIGGPYFSQQEVLDEWVNIPGVAGLVGGEVEACLAELVGVAAAHGDLSKFPGVWIKGPDGRARGNPAPPAMALDEIPFPDYTDFPWNRYPNRIIPIITGRGCAWGACAFCSDVTSSVGRTFRSRSPQNVLKELQYQHQRHDARSFAFVDLKLNSSLTMWRAILEQMQTAVPGAQWIAAVHVGAIQPNGLSADEMKMARAAGMVRLTTGLESGSQRMLDRMAKGTDLKITSRFLQDASDAGISCRTTMILGYPGEEAADVDASTEFLETNADHIERVMLNRFQIMTGTRVQHNIQRRPESFPQLTEVIANHRLAQVSHHYKPSEGRAYRRAVMRLLRVVHQINCKELREDARAFEGVM